MHAAIGSITLDLGHLTLRDEWTCSPCDQLAPNRQHAQILAMVKIVSNLIDCQSFPRRIQKPIWHVRFVLLEGASFLSG